MHGAVLVDDAGAALRPALLWPDRRAARGARPLAGAAGRRPRRAGQPAGARDDRPDAGLAGPARAGRPSRGPRPCCCPRTRCGPRSCPAPTGGHRPQRRLGDPAVGRRRPTTGRRPPSPRPGSPPELLPEVRPGAEVVGTAACRSARSRSWSAARTPRSRCSRRARPRRRRSTSAPAPRCCGPAGRPGPADDPVVHCYADVDGGWYAMAALQNGGSAWDVGVRRARACRWAELFDAAGGGAGRRRGSGLPAVPDRRARRRRRARRPGRLDRPAPGDHARRPGAGGGRGRGCSRSARRSSCSTSPTTASRSCSPAAARGPAVVQQLLADVLRRPVRHLPLRSASAVGAAVLAGRGIGLDVVPRREVGPCGAAPSCALDGPRALTLSQSAAGRRTWSRAASCSAPLVASAWPPPGPGSPGEVGEPAAGLPHDHVEGGEVPDGDLGLAGDVDGALGHQHVAPEVAVGAGAPDRAGEVEEAVEAAPLLPARQARVGQARVARAR